MLNVRAYTSSDKESCLALLRRGHDPSFSAARFNWLHEECPGGRSLGVVCCDGERVIGFYAAIPKRVIANDRVVTGARDIDPVVDPGYRGRGIFGRLLDYALETFIGIDYFFNFANDASRPGFLSRGWRVAGLLQDAVCQLGCRRLVGPDSLLYLVTAARAPSPRRSDVLRTDPATLLQKHDFHPAPPAGRIWVERSPEYLEWRYVHSPLQRYECWALLDGSHVKRALIVRRDESSRRILVLDVLSADPFDYDLDPLVASLLRYYPGARAVMWNATPAAARHRFVINPLRRGNGYPLLVRDGSRGALRVGWKGLERVFLTHGDVEYL